jgi:hypothetical protein
MSRYRVWQGSRCLVQRSSVRSALQPAKSTSLVPAVAASNLDPPAGPGGDHDADSSVSAADLVLVALSRPHRDRAPARRLPTRVVRHGPGRRRLGRLVQLELRNFELEAWNAILFFGWAHRDERFLISFKIKTDFDATQIRTVTRAAHPCERQHGTSLCSGTRRQDIYIVDVLYWFTPLLLTCCPFRCTSR